MPRCNVLLLNPPYNYGDSRIETVSVPMGLLYVAAALEKRHDVHLVDLNFDCDLHETIRQMSPDFIGISALSPQFPLVIQLAREIKAKHKHPKIVVGGPHATIGGAALLEKFTSVDYVLRGEGEAPLPDLLDGKNTSKIKGLVFREGNTVVDNGCAIVENLDSLTFPARHLVDLSRYKDFPFYYLNHKHTPLLTSRGCPHRCVYCYDTPVKRYREHSPEYVLEELRYLKGQGYNDFRIIDDVFTYNPARVEEICKRIIEEGLSITWTCETRVDRVSPGLLSLMRQAGCHLIFFGIESGNQEVLDKAGKKVTLDSVRKAVREAKNAGLRVHGGFILGFPFETEAQLDDTIEFSRSIGLHAAEYTIATPYPGTGLWNQSRYTDIFDLEVLRNLNFSSVSGSHFHDEKYIARKYSQAITGFYFRRKEFFDTVKHVLTAGTFQRRWELFKYITFNGPADAEGPSHDELPTTPTLIEKFFSEQCQLCHGCDHTCKRRWFCYCQKIMNNAIYKAYRHGVSAIERYDSFRKRKKTGRNGQPR